MKLVCLDQAPSQPWRNGGGRTRELLADPGPSDWAVRVSVAEVDSDGPFSVFTDVERWFAVLDGTGVELTIDGRSQHLGRGDPPLCFAGTAITTCRLLGGPSRDLNLMLRQVPGRMRAVDDGREWRPELRQCGLFSVVPGECIADGVATVVPGDALLWFDRAPVRLSFSARQPTTSPAAWWLEAGAPGSSP